jgi:hypothetical protein
VDAALSQDPDRSHLADAIHFMDLIHLADEELPAARATVERSKAAAVRAQVELDKHQPSSLRASRGHYSPSGF